MAGGVNKVDVAVVGGGPGGMAAALCIQRAAPHLRVRVYERARRLLPMGYTIGLTENGQSCLKAMGEDVWEEFEKNRFGPQDSVSTYIVHLPKAGTPEAAKGPPQPVLQPPQQIRSTAKYCRWHDLQAGLAQFLEPGTVQLGHSFVSLSDPGDGDEGSHVTLRFIKSSAPPGTAAPGGDPLPQEEVEVQAKLVIGADGNQSAVRQAILEDGPPEFLNQITWRGVGPSAAKVGWPFPYGGRTVVWMSDWATISKHATASQTGPGSMWAHWGGPEDPVLWAVFSPWRPDSVDLVNKRYYGNEGVTGLPKGTERLARCLDALRIGEYEVERWPEWAVKAIKGTKPERFGEHALFCREADTCTTWVKGRVGLLGDAAHLGTANLGQGTNMTLEDAVELARSIGKHGPTPEALKEYERVRGPRVYEIQDGSTTMAKNSSLKGIRGQSELQWHAERPHVIAWRAEPLVPVAPAAVPVGAGAGAVN